MVDIICRVCGDQWDSGSRDDMRGSEWNMLLKGKGCPTCDGVLPVDCTKFEDYNLRLSELKEACEFLEQGYTCSKDGDCEFKKVRPRVDAFTFLNSLDNATDGHEAEDAAYELDREG